MTTDKPTVLLVDDNRDDEELTIRGFRRANLQSTIDVAPRRPSRDRRFSTPTKFVGYTGLCPRVSYLFGIQEQPPKPLRAVVLLDLKLPRVDGLEVLERIRAEERTRCVPVVILTSSREDHDLIDRDDLGANSYARKPVQFDQFATAVAHLGIYWVMINQPAPPTENDTRAEKTTPNASLRVGTRSHPGRLSGAGTHLCCSPRSPGRRPARGSCSSPVSFEYCEPHEDRGVTGPGYLMAAR